MRALHPARVDGRAANQHLGAWTGIKVEDKVLVDNETETVTEVRVPLGVVGGIQAAQEESQPKTTSSSSTTTRRAPRRTGTFRTAGAQMGGHQITSVLICVFQPEKKR